MAVMPDEVIILPNSGEQTPRLALLRPTSGKNGT